MNIKPDSIISTSLDLSGALSGGVILSGGFTTAKMICSPQSWESGPHQYQLVHKRNGVYVLQASYQVCKAGAVSTEWRDVPTIEEEPEKPKNDWARPTKWGGRV